MGIGYLGGDIRLSAYSVPSVEIRAATVRGILHRHRGTERQDEFSVSSFDDDSTVLVVVADGVGSLPRSREIASVACRTVPAAWAEHAGDWDSVFAAVNTEMNNYVAYYAAGDRSMATTLTCLTARSTPGGYLVEVAWIGDSPCVVLQDSSWRWLTAEDGDDVLAGTPVTTLPRADAVPRKLSFTLPGGAVFVMSDGVGTPLELAPQVGQQLAEWWHAPPDAFTFGLQVGFTRKGFTDDRTAVGLWLDPMQELTETHEPNGAER